MNNDRVAKTERENCHAYGCPMLGTISDSTNGSGDWYCWLHFQEDRSKMQSITIALRQNEWLSKTVRELKVSYGTPSWPYYYRKAKELFSIPERSHLTKTKEESVYKWMLRLENELVAICAPDKKVGKEVLQLLKSHEPMQKVQFNVHGDSHVEKEVGNAGEEGPPY